MASLSSASDDLLGVDDEFHTHRGATIIECMKASQFFRRGKRLPYISGPQLVGDRGETKLSVIYGSSM
ncbi:hypothetical protein QCA50_020328 [Cerrena zonata]|uniref:Uncharacterized protein n=1 Tax=Cerrena zonata TaxID=2478898 RepID=A0AAW0FHB7_9APHY